MKNIKTLVVVAMLFALNTISAQAVTGKWKELDNYGALIEKVFVSTQDGNTETLKINAVAIAEDADRLTIPAEINDKKYNEYLIVLKRQAKLVSTLVEKKAEKVETIRALQNLHDTYLRTVKAIINN
jgi:hypothetical protein